MYNVLAPIFEKTSYKIVAINPFRAIIALKCYYYYLKKKSREILYSAKNAKKGNPGM